MQKQALGVDSQHNVLLTDLDLTLRQGNELGMAHAVSKNTDQPTSSPLAPSNDSIVSFERGPYHHTSASTKSSSGDKSLSPQPPMLLSASVVSAVEANGGESSMDSYSVEHTESMIGGPRMSRIGVGSDRGDFTNSMDTVDTNFTDISDDTNLEGLVNNNSSGNSSNNRLRKTSAVASAVSPTANPHAEVARSMAEFKDQYGVLQERFLGLTTNWNQIGARHIAGGNLENSSSRLGISDNLITDDLVGADAAIELNSMTIAGLSRQGFEGVSREMLVDYCWELHRTLAKALVQANMVTSSDRDQTGLTSPIPSTAGRSAVVTASGAGHPSTSDKAWQPELHKGPEKTAPSIERTRQTSGTVASRSPQPPNSRVRGLANKPHSRSNLTRLASAATVASDTNNSVQSMARPPVSVTQHAITAADPDQYNSMLNDYVLLHVIGKGCYGVVRQAYHQVQQRYFAVKVLKRGPQHQPLHPSYNQQGAQQHVPVQEARDVAVQREIAVMKKLRHKNIVSLFEVIDDPQQHNLYLIMQYIDMGAVGQVGPDMLCTTRLDPTTMANYGRQICAGLQYLHNHNVVHRDIKPDNILKDSNDQVYLADFGVSEMFDQAGAESNSKKASPEGEMTARTQVAGRHGTPAFMAPELLSHDPSYEHDGMALDVWALGVTFYCFLVGCLPFRSRSEIVQADLGIPEDVPFEWAALLMQMLQKNPKDRPSIADVRKMVKTLQEAGAPQPETVDTDMAAGDNIMPADDDDVASAFTPRLDSAIQSTTSSAFSRKGGSQLGGTSRRASSTKNAAQGARVAASPTVPKIPAQKVSVASKVSQSGTGTTGGGNSTPRARKDNQPSALPATNKKQQKQETAVTSSTSATNNKSKNAAPAPPTAGSQQPPPPPPQQPNTGRPGSNSVTNRQGGSGGGNSSNGRSSSAVPTLPPMSSNESSVDNKSNSSNDLVSPNPMPGQNPVIADARGNSQGKSGTYYGNQHQDTNAGVDVLAGQQQATPRSTSKKWHAGVPLPKLGDAANTAVKPPKYRKQASGSAKSGFK